jgi:hypothetical protein
MTYPPSSPGYQSNQPTTQFAAPAQQLGRSQEPSQAAPGKLPQYLNIAVAVFGLAVYLANFGPLFTISNSDFPQLGTASGSTTELGLAVVAALLAGLVAGAALLPKQKSHDSWVAIISVVAFLVILAQVLSAPSEVTIGWGLYVVAVFSFLQAAAAIANLLLNAGVITAPEPKPRYDQQQGYGQYPPQYYGHQQGGQQHSGQHQGPPQQRPGGYPQQYGGYPGGPSTGGFPAPGQQTGQQSGPPTPPTGFPAYGQPQPPGSSADTGPQGTVQTPQHQAQPTQPPTSQQAAPPPS